MIPVSWPFSILFKKEKKSEPVTREVPATNKKPICAVVGLGNPGESYRGTRHNIGFQFMDFLAEQERQTWKKEKRFKAEVAICTISNQKILLAKPQTFVNESGQSLSSLMRYHRWQPSSIVVVHDEINLPLGEVKLTDRGGPGGHNGMVSILQCGGQGVLRLRLGIGHKNHPGMDLKDHVLGRFSADDLRLVQSKMEQWVEAVQLIVDKGPAKAMNFINRKSN